MRWNGQHVLVTGGTGFIGSFVVEHLLDAGAHVRVPLRAQNYRALSARRAEIDWLEGDLRDSSYCTELVEGVSHVFHLASCRRNSEYHQKRCSDVLNENVRMSLALLEALKERPSVPVTFFSTANVPPNLDTVALSQGESVDGYVLGKAICETLWFTAARQRKFPLLIVRPVGAYGPRDTFTEEGNVIPALMVKTRDSEDALHVWGDGTQERAFLYVEDLVKAAFLLIEAGAQGIQYITTKDVVTVKELAESIRNLVQPKLAIKYDTSKTVINRTIPTLPLHPALKKFAWTPFQEGLRRTYESWNTLPTHSRHDTLSVA
jgi:nucleoside-diphosphate-sugar epimerase